MLCSRRFRKNETVTAFWHSSAFDSGFFLGSFLLYAEGGLRQQTGLIYEDAGKKNGQKLSREGSDG